MASSPHSWGRSSQTCSLHNYNQRSFLVHKKGTMGVRGEVIHFGRKFSVGIPGRTEEMRC